MAVVVSVRELTDELKLLTSEHHAYLNQVTGKAVTITDHDISAVEMNFVSFVLCQQPSFWQTRDCPTMRAATALNEGG